MDSSRLLRTTGLALAVAGLLTSGCSSGGPAAGADAGRAAPRAALLQPLDEEIPEELKPYYGQKLRWRKCGADGFECARMRAPLDYGKPGKGGDIELAVARKKATGRGGHLGSLLVNPGGPGGSAVDYLRTYAGIGYPQEVRERYDMVAVDPRGVARSEPVRCLPGRQMDALTQVDLTPDDQAEVETLVEAFRGFAQGCQRRSGELLGHISTIDSARDMDVLRELLGDEKLNYVGASYGTFLGATYAGLFPSRSGRLVLDGAMDPALSARRMNRDQTAGFDTAFTAFAEDCAGRKDCPLEGGNAQEVGESLQRFFRKLDAEPLATGEDRRLTESLATTAVIAAMYDEGAWARLREELKQAMAGKGEGLLKLSDLYYERGADGSYSNLMPANSAINCLDLPAAFKGPEEVREHLGSFRKASPVFGTGLAWEALSCAYWPVEATGKPRRIEAEGADPILVVGTTRDPATPYVWARSLADQLRSGRLLTYVGDGHTAYGRGSHCVDSTINGYLLEGKAPSDGKKCG
ncbi:alpha/beta hydrolase [Streptomyces sp. TP-A0874]|uniref:alpha/beta hydrolase n=1 Tax=Streptomyces sp. TP-A0874 TaxID=549819 RepID=UPI0008537633|nr:alpha/beta hydrolase [Streptomyces sp. TP-A0874]